MLTAKIGSLALKNPIMSASGTFGFGGEGCAFSDVARLGALVSKTVTVAPRPGNPPPRIVETASGMLNSIGLENRGADHFIAETLPKMRALGTAIIINIGGEEVSEFEELARRFAAAGVDGLEVNLSCPNVQGGRLYFSTVPALTQEVVERVKQACGPNLPVWAKLSPNVADITEIALAAERGGADGITAINTLIGMAVDWRRRTPILARTIGGLSGPAIKPVALRQVFEIARVVTIPVIGVGGIASAEDVLEFLVAGAAAVQIGTHNFSHPAGMVSILDELERLLAETDTTVADLTGSLSRSEPSTGSRWRDCEEVTRP